MPKMSDKALLARDAKRDIGAELLQSVRDLKAGRWGRKTTIATLPDGSVKKENVFTFSGFRTVHEGFVAQIRLRICDII